MSSSASASLPAAASSSDAASQRGADRSPDVVSMNVGAKTFEHIHSNRIQQNLLEVAQAIKDKERAVCVCGGGSASRQPYSPPPSFPSPS